MIYAVLLEQRSKPPVTGGRAVVVLEKVGLVSDSVEMLCRGSDRYFRK